MTSDDFARTDGPAWVDYDPRRNDWYATCPQSACNLWKSGRFGGPSGAAGGEGKAQAAADQHNETVHGVAS